MPAKRRRIESLVTPPDSRDRLGDDMERSLDSGRVQTALNLVTMSVEMLREELAEENDTNGKMKSIVTLLDPIIDMLASERRSQGSHSER
ncbi:MAG: hypothetical protein M1823_004204 [Watsoniomyces obsoletus]|nr:MAG: hypothetical protein M1823_004204 [Watsoniomyces obsoletus]